MRVLTTGSEGVVGRAITQPIIDRGHEVFRYDWKADPNLNLLDYFQVERTIDEWQPEVIIHLAAIPAPRRRPFSDYFRINVSFTESLIRTALKGGVQKFIYASSSAYYGCDTVWKPLYLPIDESHPPNMNAAGPVFIDNPSYPISKILAERVIKGYSHNEDCEFVVLRMGPVIETEAYFDGIAGVQNWTKSCLFTWSDPRDLGDAYIKAIEKDMPSGYDIFNIMGTLFPVDFKPDGMSPRDWITEYYEVSADDLPSRATFFSSSKAMDVLGWYPMYSLKGVEPIYGK